MSTGTAPALDGQLEAYRQQFEKIKADARAVMAGLTGLQAYWRPGAGRWSIAECLLHLNVTAELYLPALDRAIERAEAQGWRAPGPFRHTLAGRWLIGVMEPPPTRRFRTPDRLQPRREQAPDRILADFLALQDALLDRLARAAGLHLGRARLRSPVFRLLRLNLLDAFGLIAAHERRHLWQARQLRIAQKLPV